MKVDQTLHDNCHMKLVMQVFEIGKTLLLTLGTFFFSFATLLSPYWAYTPGIHQKIPQNSHIMPSEDKFLQSIGGQKNLGHCL